MAHFVEQQLQKSDHKSKVILYNPLSPTTNLTNVIDHPNLRKDNISERMKHQYMGPLAETQLSQGDYLNMNNFSNF